MKAQQLLAYEKHGYQRVEPPCAYFGACGGCTLQDLRYPDQLALKRQRVERLFGELGVVVPPVSIEGLDDPWRYRNKAEFTFGEQDGQLILGYHAARSFWRVVDLEDCHLLPSSVMAVVRDVYRAASETHLPAYQARTHQGFFRFLLVRHSQASGHVLLCVMTTAGHQEAMERLAQSIVLHHPEMNGFLWGITERLADVAIPDMVRMLHGEDAIDDQIGPFRLRIRARSFLQPTNQLADRLYTALADAVTPVADGIGWDLYCGTGLVALYLARRMRKVYGIDLETEYVESAEHHAQLNGITNVEFRSGRVEALLQDRRFWLQEAKPDVIVVDPPRAGLHPQALAGLLAARPKLLVYVSCNPQSLLSDLNVLLRSFPRYQLRQVRVFDLFPQTNHVEVLTVLGRA